MTSEDPRVVAEIVDALESGILVPSWIGTQEQPLCPLGTKLVPLSFLTEADNKIARTKEDARLGQEVDGWVVMNTPFTGEPPYVGNEGIMRALRELKAERDDFRKQLDVWEASTAHVPTETVGEDKGPWHVRNDGRDVSSEDFKVDASLSISGDFEDKAHLLRYANWLATQLNESQLVGSVDYEKGFKAGMRFQADHALLQATGPDLEGELVGQVEGGDPRWDGKFMNYVVTNHPLPFQSKVQFITPTTVESSYGWKAMTKAAMDMKLRHVDNHQGDIYHALQTLIVQFGSPWDGKLTEPTTTTEGVKP